jgi:20S proteasome alpha/beta subunit
MTQIVAALCKNRTMLAVVSDRMVSDEYDTLHFEHEPKGQMLSYNAMIFYIGTMHEPEIIDASRAEVAGRMKLPQMIEILTKNYRATRKKRVETEILSKYGFQSYDDYHNQQRQLTDATVECIEGELTEYELDLTILFAGIDATGTQIYLIDDPGTAHSHTEVGFCCVGSGERHADPVFAFYGYNPSMSVEEALYIAYVAKRRAEMAGGVGKATDAWVISQKGCYKVKDNTLRKLDDCLQKANLADLQISIDIEYEDKPELPNAEG